MVQLEDNKKALRREQPQRIHPMLATLTREYFSDSDWIYERKLDGMRCLAFKDEKEKVRLLSRNGKERASTFPDVVPALRRQRVQFIADGEIVAFKGKVTSFSRLQPRINVVHPEQELIKAVPVYLYLFDLLHLDGFDVSCLELRARKSLLKQTLSFAHPRLRFCPHINERGRDYYHDACKKGWEGIIAKHAAKPYTHGRSNNWLKFKCVSRQELVIGGFTEPAGKRIGFGALLVGYYDQGKLVYAGKVGTGYSEEQLKMIHTKLMDIEQQHSPFSGDFKVNRQVHWLRPLLVAEIGFSEWTSAGKLRHPRFIGLRNDKSPEEVCRE